MGQPYLSIAAKDNLQKPWAFGGECEDKTIEMFLRFRCLDLNSCKLFHSMLLALKASTIGLIFIFPIFNEEVWLNIWLNIYFLS